jgi:hypothetical protein
MRGCHEYKIPLGKRMARVRSSALGAAFFPLYASAGSKMPSKMPELLRLLCMEGTIASLFKRKDLWDNACKALLVLEV